MTARCGNTAADNNIKIWSSLSHDNECPEENGWTIDSQGHREEPD